MVTGEGDGKALKLSCLEPHEQYRKDAVASALCNGPETLVSQQNWWRDNLVSSGRNEEQVGIQLELIGQLEPVSLIAFLSDTLMAAEITDALCHSTVCLGVQEEISGNCWRTELACCPGHTVSH